MYQENTQAAVPTSDPCRSQSVTICMQERPDQAIPPGAPVDRARGLYLGVCSEKLIIVVVGRGVVVSLLCRSWWVWRWHTHSLYVHPPHIGVTLIPPQHRGHIFSHFPPRVGPQTFHRTPTCRYTIPWATRSQTKA